MIGFGANIAPWVVPESVVPDGMKATLPKVMGSYGALVSFFVDILKPLPELSFTAYRFSDVSSISRHISWIPEENFRYDANISNAGADSHP